MIKSFIITNDINEKITLDISNPEKSGLLIKEVSGLGPAKANINTDDYATNDGSTYNSSRLDKRNIVFDILFYGNDIESIRRKCYRYFPLKKKIKIQIITDDRFVETYGYVEANEVNIFSKEEGSNVSIICPDPHFYQSDSITSIIFSGIESLFEFPFSNESLEENKLEFGYINYEKIKNIIYKGEAETGIVMTIHANDIAKNITIYNERTGEKFYIDTDKIKTITKKDFGKDDEIIISTVQGNKYAKLLRNGEYTNIINCIDRKSVWFKLQKGDNIFAYKLDQGENDIEFKIDYKLKYIGV